MSESAYDSQEKGSTDTQSHTVRCFQGHGLTKVEWPRDNIPTRLGLRVFRVSKRVSIASLTLSPTYLPQHTSSTHDGGHVQDPMG